MRSIGRGVVPNRTGFYQTSWLSPPVKSSGLIARTPAGEHVDKRAALPVSDSFRPVAQPLLTAQTPGWLNTLRLSNPNCRPKSFPAR